MPVFSALASSGAAVRSARMPGRSSRIRPSVLARNGRWRGRLSMPASSAGLPPVIESWMYGRDTSRSAAIVASTLRNSEACVSAAGATIAVVSLSSWTNGPEPGLRPRQVLHHRDDVAQQRAEGADRGVDRLAAAGERGPEALEVRLRRGPGLLVEHVQELVELDRRLGVRERDRVAVLVALARVPARDLDVLEAERRARADQQRRVRRQRPGVLVERQAEHRDHGAVAAASWA